MSAHANAPGGAGRDHARSAGRGLLSIATAKIYFIVASFGVQFSLPRLFGSSELFGLFSTAMSGISILNNVLIASTIQTVSKFVSEDEERSPAVLRQALRLQAAIGGVLCAAVLLNADLLSRFMEDPGLAPLLRASAVVVLCYAVYAAMVGSLNGRQQYGRQAQLDMGFTTLRSIGIVAGAAMGVGAIGAMGGFAAAAVAITVIATFRVGLGAKGKPIPLGRFVGFMAPIWIYQGFLNGVLQVDVWVIKKTLAQLALVAGASAEAAAATANQYVGHYRGAQTFAFVPYQLVLSMTFIIFPVVSRATAAGDEQAARAAVRGALRFSALALLGMAGPIAGSAEGLLRVAYGPEYAAGAPALRVLAFGLVAFTLFVLSATALGGAGRPAVSASLAGPAVLVVVVANRLLVMRAGLGEHTLEAAAAGTSLGMLVAMVAAGVAVHLRFGTFVPAWTAARGALAAAAGFFAALHAAPQQALLGALVSPVVGFAAFLATLALTGEIGREELRLVRSVLRRGR